MSKYAIALAILAAGIALMIYLEMRDPVGTLPPPEGQGQLEVVE